MIVLDSSFLIGFHNERDAHHTAAKALMERFLRGEWGNGLLLEYVFLEVMTVLLVRRDLSVASSVGQLLLAAEELEFVPCSDLFAETLKTFSGQGSTRWSFADAAIAHVARHRADGLVLTFDDELRKAASLRVPQP
ncbi:MAG: type II toxin-antitoxin system VapC family toxin [Bryobacterales bacterium]|nr:type II toxin-antitoxin system VapC family toxin [Bryobacterales bacterium]